MEPLVKGIISGITISLMIGPIFFALADITITKGWRCGFSYIAGVLISDLILIFFVETAFHRFSFEALKTPIGLIGGSVLILFGLITFVTEVNLKAPDVTTIQTLTKAFLKGVSINLFNPFVTLWWITMYTTVSIKYQNLSDRSLFYGGILSMVFLFDILKMRFAYYLREHLTVSGLNKLKKVVGIFLFIFGATMIWRVLF